MQKAKLSSSIDLMVSAKDITDLMVKKTKENEALVERAYSFAKKAHGDQKRFSGEPYFESHVVEVAKNLARLHMDAKTIAAGLLHDTVEDSNISDEEILKEFGPEISFLVKGVTKLGKLKYRGLERHVESLRKFFIATGQDARVIVIKLADRLHNVSTLRHVPEAKRKRIALETLEIYAPIANRLGIGRIQGELEDYSFEFAYPKEFEQVKKLLKERETAGELEAEKIKRSLRKELAENGVKSFKTDSRIKHLWSLYLKLKRHDMDMDKIYDLVALRIIVPSIEDCYRVLGIIHKKWRPLPGRIKDYIALPKPNGYQSIHTTVFSGDGGIIEIQIRTKEMHEEAEFGIASHLGYKEVGKKKSKPKEENVNKKLEWIQEITEWQKNVSKSGEFLEHLKMDFFKNRVFVFTPQGDVIELPEESSPIDFAYAIHSDVGNHVSGAKVNGKLVALNTKLKNADIVEISTKEGSKPSAKWLEFTKTAFARKQIKSHAQEGLADQFAKFLKGNK
ncbi:MAG: RelA/SpoT family protein [Candidatus Paceibacterota bacterium]